MDANEQGERTIMAPGNSMLKIRGMWRRASILGACLIGLASLAAAQAQSGTKDPAGNPLQGVTGAIQADGDAPTNQADADDAAGSISESAPVDQRPVSWKRLPRNVLYDQKYIWLFPVHAPSAAGRKYLKPTLLLLAATGAMVALDPYDEPYFRNTSAFNSFKTGPLRGRNTTLAIASVPVATYLAGMARDDSYAKSTALLTGESVADAQIVVLALKAVTGRRFPSGIPPHGDFTHTWFKYTGSISNPGSFPSGHAAVAFAAASVFASRYHEHRWVPWLAYGAATFIALSRLPDQAHFPSDVFAGAALGYAVSHFMALPRR